LTSSNQGAARTLAQRQAAGRLIASLKMAVSLRWVYSAMAASRRAASCWQVHIAA
jgi:hypothetical protein